MSARNRNKRQVAYFGFPKETLNAPAYVALSYRAKSLLFDMRVQYTGFNNGHLACAYSWMSRDPADLPKGWDILEQTEAIRRLHGNINAKVSRALVHARGGTNAPDPLLPQGVSTDGQRCVGFAGIAGSAPCRAQVAVVKPQILAAQIAQQLDRAARQAAIVRRR